MIVVAARTHTSSPPGGVKVNVQSVPVSNVVGELTAYGVVGRSGRQIVKLAPVPKHPMESPSLDTSPPT